LPVPTAASWNAAALGSAAHGADEIILCEALIDALTFWCAATQRHGELRDRGFNADHCRVQAHSVKRVLIAYDRDEAGDRAAEKLAKQLLAEASTAIASSSPKHGSNEYALKVTPAAKSLDWRSGKAQMVGREMRNRSTRP